MKFDATNILLSIIIAGLGWLLVQQYETKAAVVGVDAKATAWIQRTIENSDDIDELRKHTHTGTTVAMYDMYEDE